MDEKTPDAASDGTTEDLESVSTTPGSGGRRPFALHPERR